MKLELNHDEVDRFEKAYQKACNRGWKQFTFNGTVMRTEGAGKSVMYAKMAMGNGTMGISFLQQGER